MKRIPWNIIRHMLGRLPRNAAEHVFAFTLILVALAGALSLLLLYVYGFSAQTRQIEQETSLYDFKEELLLDTQEELEERERNLENAGKETSLDIFNPD